MPYRNIVFANNEIYHIVNRGVAQQPIFLDKTDYQRALKVADFYRYPRSTLRFSEYNRLSFQEKVTFLETLKNRKEALVEILSFCLMPNHFHFLFKQLQDKGSSVFMKNFQNSYARYFNIKHKRRGHLFESMFRAVRVETDEQLLHVSRYIHLNPVSSYLIEVQDLQNYPWSSFPQFIQSKSLSFVAPKTILGFFKTKEHYQEFVFNQADYQRELENIKYLTLEK